MDHEAHRLLILIGRTVEQSVLERASQPPAGSAAELSASDIRKAFQEFLADGLEDLEARVADGEIKLHAYREAG